MIVENQKNIKIHFASAETAPHLIGAVAAGVRYLLFSVFKLIAPRFDIATVRVFQGLNDIEIPRVIDTVSRHSIMDSGVFSLMFGSYQRDCDRKFLSRWQSVMVEFIQESGYQGTVVELDVQKILDVETAWILRRRLKKQLPHNRIMNVFHIEDGQRGLDRLIEYSDYLAIGLPELRKLGKRDYAVRLTNYIKEKKPDIDIHLLGCTDLALLKKLNFCSSADSTSWIGSVLFGEVKTYKGSFRSRLLTDHEYLDRYQVETKKVRERFGFRETSVDYSAKAAYGAHHAKFRYATACGNQE